MVALVCQPAPVLAKFITFNKKSFGERFYLKSIAFTMSIMNLEDVP